LVGLATITLGFALWELLLRAGFREYQNLPAPSAIANGLVEITNSGQLFADTRHTLAVLVGWTAALVSGRIGLTARRLEHAAALFAGLDRGPAPDAGHRVRAGGAPAVRLLAADGIDGHHSTALWPVLINTMGAVLGVHARLFEAGRTFRLSQGEILRKIMLPARCGRARRREAGMTLALVLAIVAEMVGNPAGLGYAVVREQQAMRPELVFAYVVVIGALGVILNAALTGAVAVLFPPRPVGCARRADGSPAEQPGDRRTAAFRACEPSAARRLLPLIVLLLVWQMLSRSVTLFPGPLQW